MLILGHKYESVWANIGSWKIWESNDQKNFGVIIDINLTLIDVCGRGGWGWGWGVVILPPSWFSLNNSNTVKVVTLEMCSI